MTPPKNDLRFFKLRGQKIPLELELFEPPKSFIPSFYHLRVVWHGIKFRSWVCCKDAKDIEKIIEKNGREVMATVSAGFHCGNFNADKNFLIATALSIVLDDIFCKTAKTIYNAIQGLQESFKLSINRLYEVDNFEFYMNCLTKVARRHPPNVGWDTWLILCYPSIREIRRKLLKEEFQQKFYSVVCYRRSQNEFSDFDVISEILQKADPSATDPYQFGTFDDIFSTALKTLKPQITSSKFARQVWDDLTWGLLTWVGLDCGLSHTEALAIGEKLYREFDYRRTLNGGRFNEQPYGSWLSLMRFYDWFDEFIGDYVHQRDRLDAILDERCRQYKGNVEKYIRDIEGEGIRAQIEELQRFDSKIWRNVGTGHGNCRWLMDYCPEEYEEITKRWEDLSDFIAWLESPEGANKNDELTWRMIGALRLDFGKSRVEARQAAESYLCDLGLKSDLFEKTLKEHWVAIALKMFFKERFNKELYLGIMIEGQILP